MATVNGAAVKPVNIKGKDYILVADRVHIAHETAKEQQFGFQIVDEIISQVLDHAYIKVTINVNGYLFIGTSEIKFNAPKNTPDGQAPFECAETSAIGRALGFAGFGMIDSIASADEMARVLPQETKRETAAKAMKDQQTQSNRVQASATVHPVKQAPAADMTHDVSEAMATDNQIANIKKLDRVLGYADERNCLHLTFTQAKELLAKLSGEYSRSRQSDAQVPVKDSPIDDPKPATEDEPKTFKSASIYAALHDLGFTSVDTKENVCRVAIGYIPGKLLSKTECETIRAVALQIKEEQAAENREEWPFDVDTTYEDAN